jgi:hypothetical protein
VEHIRGANRHGAGPVYTFDTDLPQPLPSLGTAVKILRPFERGRGRFEYEGARFLIVFQAIKGGPPILHFLLFFFLSSTSPTSTHLSHITITFLCVRKAQHLLPLAHQCDRGGIGSHRVTSSFLPAFLPHQVFCYSISSLLPVFLHRDTCIFTPCGFSAHSFARFVTRASFLLDLSPSSGFLPRAPCLLFQVLSVGSFLVSPICVAGLAPGSTPDHRRAFSSISTIFLPVFFLPFSLLHSFTIRQSNSPSTSTSTRASSEAPFAR